MESKTFLENELPFFNYSKTSSKEILQLLKNDFGIKKYEEFIKKKKKYLEENRTISKEKFEELFGGSGKYGKSEIKQGNIGLCYAYTGFEILKKTNFFNELIQTNFREVSEGKREVRIPFNSKGYWMKVSEGEIDKKYRFKPRSGGNEKEVIVNTNTSLGFKILEIAFLKSYFLFNPKYSQNLQCQTDRDNFKNTGNIEITSELLKRLEKGNTRSFLQHILGDNVVLGNDSDKDSCVDKDLVQQYFKTGLIRVSLGLPSKSKNMRIKNLKIIDKNNIEVKKEKSVNYSKKRKHYFIFTNHRYSIERFYEKDGEMKVLVVNPRNTSEKIDISLQECKDRFEWEVLGFDIDKMFK